MLDGVQIYLFLLLAVAAGWLLGRWRGARSRTSAEDSTELFADYFVGLNYLLNDEPDEAIDTFIKSLEVNSDTIETHLALGALLRRRGKVDKAIKVHQTLLARPGLDQQRIDAIRLQLAIDYITAGLLDRAERLLKEILEEDTPAKWDALRHLITIYQTEKEWQQAIDCSRHLLTSSVFRRNQEVRSAAAHYCCELAELRVAESQFSQARELIKRAFTFDRHSVRAALLLADIEQKLGNYRAALRELLRTARGHADFTGRILQPMAECYQQLNARDEYEQVLRELLAADRCDVHVMVALARLIQAQGGDASAVRFLTGQLEREPNLAGVLELLRIQVPAADGELQTNLQQLQKMLNQLLGKRPFYRCHHCGYEARTLYWLCPSCQKWDRMRPILEASNLWN